jgi:hypothetical protein
LPRIAERRSVIAHAEEVLIHAPGFEDRTLASAKVVRAPHMNRAILLRYRPHNSANRLSEVREALTGRGFVTTEADVITYDRFAPAGFEARLKARLRALNAHGALVDISTMSKLAILLVLGVCHELRLSVRVFYAEAEQYGPTKDEFDRARESGRVHQPSLQIYSGVHGVIRVNSLASVAMQGQPTAALVFMSFNDALTQVLLNTVFPGRLLLINGRPPVHRWREAATAWIHDQVRQEWTEDNPVSRQAGRVKLPKRVVCTLQYRETVEMLLRLYWNLSRDHRVLLAPSGSKMQAVGCYLVKAIHPDIHIEYPSPEGFMPEYSHGIGPKWLVDFGDFAGTLAKLMVEERRSVLEIHA